MRVHDDIPAAMKQITWVVVADGTRMCVYECDLVQKILSDAVAVQPDPTDRTDKELRHLPDLDMAAQTLDEYQPGNNDRRAGVSTTSSVRHAGEPHADLRDELKERFAKDIVRRLDFAGQEKAYNHLILVASQKMMGKIRASMSPSLARLVAVEIPKDLIRCTSRELAAHVKDALIAA